MKERRRKEREQGREGEGKGNGASRNFPMGKEIKLKNGRGRKIKLFIKYDDDVLFCVW